MPQDIAILGLGKRGPRPRQWIPPTDFVSSGSASTDIAGCDILHANIPSDPPRFSTRLSALYPLSGFIIARALPSLASMTGSVSTHGRLSGFWVCSIPFGGSGRPRFLRIDDARAFTVSTALTFDRKGRCIEGNGVPVDQSLPDPLTMMRRGIDPVAGADRHW